MKKDIEDINDIKLLVDRFYEKVKQDEVIGYIFNDIARVNWEKHLPVMYTFWENVLFYTGGYLGNPMEVHQHLHVAVNLSKEHFTSWNQLFLETVDELFEGKNAILAKQRALSISTAMQIKILKFEDGGMHNL